VVPSSSSTTAVLKTAPRVGTGATYWLQVTSRSFGVNFPSPGSFMVGAGSVELDWELGDTGREKTLTVQFSICRVYLA